MWREWVDVNTRLPEREGYYLIYADYGDFDFMKFSEGEFTGVCCYPTHWMELPDIPETPKSFT